MEQPSMLSTISQTPGVPWLQPSSQSSPHSVLPLPQRQSAGQGFVPPGHSLGSHTLLPQVGGGQAPQSAGQVAQVSPRADSQPLPPQIGPVRQSGLPAQFGSLQSARPSQSSSNPPEQISAPLGPCTLGSLSSQSIKQVPQTGRQKPSPSRSVHNEAKAQTPAPPIAKPASITAQTSIFTPSASVEYM